MFTALKTFFGSFSISEKKHAVNLHDTGFGNGFLAMIRKALQQKENLINWTLSKLKTRVYRRTSSRK